MAKVKVKGAVLPEGATVETRPDLFGTRGQFAPDGEGGLVTFMNAGDKPEFATPEASKVDGGFYVGDRGLPWHVTLARQLGTRELMADAGKLLTTAEALSLSGSFEVEKQPIFLASGKQVADKFATVRTDTGDPLGVVGNGYKVFQEKELAELADYIVDQGAHVTPVYETGGHMFGGRVFFLSMELAGLDIVVPNDPSKLQTYLLLMTSHDGSKKLGYFVTTVRTVCRNTADLATKGALRTYTIRHVGSLEGKLQEARKALGIALKTTETVEQITQKLALTKVVDSQVREIFEKAWPVKASEDSDEAVEVKSRHVERAFANYQASETLEGIRGTAWGALQAGTEYVDWGISYHGRRLSAEDARAESLLFGTAHETKERLIKAALAAK